MKKTIMALMATTFLMTAGAASAAINPVNIGESSSASNIYSVILDKVEAGEVAGSQSGFAWAYVNGGFVSLSVTELQRHGANAGKFFSEYVGKQVKLDLAKETEDSIASLKKAMYEAVVIGVDPAVLNVAKAQADRLQVQLDGINADIAGHADLVASFPGRVEATDMAYDEAVTMLSEKMTELDGSFCQLVFSLCSTKQQMQLIKQKPLKWLLLPSIHVQAAILLLLVLLKLIVQLLIV